MDGPDMDAALPPDVRQRRAFQKPWHATAFAMLLSLHQAGRFTWPQWTEIFARREKISGQREAECIEDAYYRRIVETLLELLSAQRLLRPSEVDAVAAAWRSAYLATPHGQPVELTPDALARSLGCETAPQDGDPRSSHHHDSGHHHRHERHRNAMPVAVSPAGSG